MKNKKIFLVVLAAALVLGMAACDMGGGGGSSGGGGGGSASLATAKYSNVDTAGNLYELVITKAASNTVQYSYQTDDTYVKKSLSTASSVMAAYSPSTGDTYVLTIFFTNSTTKKSSGTVVVSGTTLTLTKDTSSFTVKVNTSGQITTITALSGIPLDEGGTQAAPTMTNWSGITIDSNMGGWTFGWDEDGIVTVYDQVWWEFSSQEMLTKAKASGAKLVLVFEKDIKHSICFVWQAPDDPVWRYWEATEISDANGNVIGSTGATWNSGTKTLTIPLNSSTLTNYSIFLTETKLRFLIAYFRENGNSRLSIHHDLGIVSAKIE